jgi:hypothetical protein
LFTVIIQGKRSSDLMQDYRFLFKPFLDEGSVVFCDWNEAGTDLQSSVPDLRDIIRGKKEWRALIVSADSVYDYKGTPRPSKDNPFDFSKFDTLEEPHESPVPLVRLTHIIGGFSSTLPKEFEKGFEYIDDTGEKIRVREAELTENQIQQLSERYFDSLTPVYIEKTEDKDYAARQKEIAEKYTFNEIRPTEILLVATRKKHENDDRLKIVEAWKSHLEMTSSAFWERLKYPNNCRFLFSDITNSDNSQYQNDVTEFWLSVLSLAINKINSSTLQAYRLYKIHVDISTEELEKILNLQLNEMISAYAYVKEQLTLHPSFSFGENEDVVRRQKIPVAIENTSTADLFVDISRIGLSRDCPEEESTLWNSQVRQKKSNLELYLKSPRRAVDKSAEMLRKKTDGFLGEHYELDRFQITDINEFMNDLEVKIISSGSKNTVNKKKVNKDISEIDKKVRKNISFRLTKKTVIIGGLVILAIILAGYIPYIIQSKNVSDDALYASIGLSFGVLLLSSFGGIFALLIQRKQIKNIMREFNTYVRGIINNIQLYSLNFEEFFTNICTYMKAQSVLAGLKDNAGEDFSKSGVLNTHKHALAKAIEKYETWLVAYGIERREQVLPVVSSFFNPDVSPKENMLYFFEADDDENDIPLNSTGDMVTAPYKFVSKLWIEREDVFDEEEED